jgi:hypothetical protein
MAHVQKLTSPTCKIAFLGPGAEGRWGWGQAARWAGIKRAPGVRWAGEWWADRWAGWRQRVSLGLASWQQRENIGQAGMGGASGGRAPGGSHASNGSASSGILWREREYGDIGGPGVHCLFYGRFCEGCWVMNSKLIMCKIQGGTLGAL